MVDTYGKAGLVCKGTRLLRKVFLVKKGYILIGMSKGFTKSLTKMMI